MRIVMKLGPFSTESITASLPRVLRDFRAKNGNCTSVGREEEYLLLEDAGPQNRTSAKHAKEMKVYIYFHLYFIPIRVKIL